MKKLITIFTFILMGAACLFAQNEFEVAEGTKGVFVPRLTQPEICNMAITSADDGLLVYNTDRKTFMYVCSGCDPNGVQWMEIQSNFPSICTFAASSSEEPSSSTIQDRIEELEKQIAKLSQQMKERNKEQ